MDTILVQTTPLVSTANVATSKEPAVHRTYNQTDITNLTAKVLKEQAVLPDWISPFVGENFSRYQLQVDEQIAREQQQTPQHNETCERAYFQGEFGYELAAMVPWAYHTSQNCSMITYGSKGTKYLYYFSHNHTLYASRRESKNLPRENPFKIRTPHTRKAPTERWIMPPWKTRYRRHDVSFDKPLLIIWNKYTDEFDQKTPINFIPIHTLKALLDYLTPKYRIVYIRYERPETDDYQRSHPYPDKLMIRSNYTDVVLVDDLIKDLGSEAVNLLIFSLGALGDNFISVQGGNSVVASQFGGQNIILAKQGRELRYGDYEYYHNFSGAEIKVVQHEDALLETVKSNM